MVRILMPAGSSFARSREMCTSIAFADMCSSHDAIALAILSLATMASTFEKRCVRIENSRCERSSGAPFTRARFLARSTGERPVLDQPRLHRAAAARERRDARDQLLGREGLHEIVVGAEREAVHAIAHGVARGEHEHGLLAAVRAVALQPREAVDARQADVEDHEVDVGDLERGIGGLRARDRVGHEALAPQRFGEAVGQDRIVFNDEHSHGLQIIRLSPKEWGRIHARLMVHISSPFPVSPPCMRCIILWLAVASPRPVRGILPRACC